jgi:hypothetical protein
VSAALPQTFEARWRELLGSLDGPGREALAACQLVALPANRVPWTRTGLRVGRGDRVTLLAEGRVGLIPALGFHARPRFCLWRRIGGRGPVVRIGRDTTTFAAEADGELELAILNGEWADADGALATPAEAYAGATGELDVALLHWRAGVEPRGALEQLAAHARGEPLIAAERARLAHPTHAPPGWEPHPLLGASDAYAIDRADGRAAIRAHLVEEAAIYRHPVDIALDPTTEVRWSWKVAKLPSQVAEDTLTTHDYLSLAIELSDGRDLSWFWSAALAPGACFACPLPSWTPRETHLAVRSGNEALGRWIEERRNAYQDCALAFGTPQPRIVAVWLIGVSLFQPGEGLAWFGDVEIHSAGGATARIVPGG